MSTTIDQRVVEMQFDNKRFESNVATTMSSLDKLKQSLNFSGAAKGFENIDTAARNVDMHGLGTAVETVRTKFSALQVMGVTALSNITNSAVNAGKRILSSLTIDPIKTGFSEYELKMGSIQTIMASTGESLETVNRYLNELNEYSDKTIYSFSDMTQNIGKFTNAGVKLDDAVSAIQGISNVAAVSGANTNEASRAMYNFAQALSAGHVKLMDWKSIELANMATQEFKTYLLDAAVSAGTLTKTADGMYQTLEGNTLSATKNFNETLQDQWLTTEVLVSTLKDYADETTEIGKKAFAAAQDIKTISQLYDTLKESAQSGWAQTWELLVGDLEEAKDTLGKINDVVSAIIQNSADARNNLLKGWKDAGGRADLVESLLNVIEALQSVAAPIKEAFRDIFPPLTVEKLVSFTKGIKEVTAKLKLSESTSDKLKRTFKGLFAILDIGKQIFSAVFKAVGSLMGNVGDLGGGILEVTATFGDWLVKLSEGIKKTGIFNSVFSGVAKVIKSVISGLKTLVGWSGKLIGSLGDLFSGFGSAVSSTFDSVSDSIEDCSFIKILQSLLRGLKTIIGGIVDVIGGLVSAVGDKLGAGNFSGIFDLVNSLIAGGVGVALIRFIKGLKDSFGEIPGIFENISGMFGSLGDAIKSFTANTKSKALLNIAIAIGILSAALLVLSFIDSDKLYDSIIAISVLFAALLGTMSFMTKNLKQIKGIAKVGTAMIAISAAILILSFALKNLASLDMESMLTGLLGVAGLMAVVVLTVKALDGNKMMKGAVQLIMFAAAIKILASACIDLAALSWNELAKGLVGVSVLLAGVAVFLRIAKFDGKAFSTSLGIIALAAAIKILASACADFAYMSWEEIAKGLAAIGGLLAEIAIFTKLTGNAKKVISTGIAMIAIAAAMKIFASAIEDFAYMSWEELARGLLGMAGALAAVVIALHLMPKNVIMTGTGLVVVAAALVILAEALGRMGNMSWSALAKGLIALGGSIAILAAGLTVMTGTLAGSAALIVAAGAIAILTPALTKLGSMSLWGIIKSLIALTGAIAVIAIAGLALGPAIAPMLALAGALALIGVAVGLVGAGLLAAGIGITMLSASIATGATAVVAGLTIIVMGLVDLIPAVMRGFANGIAAFFEGIATILPSIGKAIKSVVLLIAEILVECMPILVDTILQFAIKLLDALARNAPRLIDGLFNLILGILKGLATRASELVAALVDIVVSVVQGVIDALGNAKLDISFDDIINVGMLAGIMGALAMLAPLVPAAMLGVVGFGAVIAELSIVLAAVGALSQIPGLTWLIGEGGNLLGAIGTAIGKFVGGLVGGIAQGFTSSLPQIGSDLSAFMRNAREFIDGAKLVDSSVVEGVRSLVDVVLAITGANIIQGITSWLTGGADIETFSEQLPILGDGLKGFSDSLGDISPENIVAAASAAKALADMTSSIPNEGGVAAWFAGDNSISKFGNELPELGKGLKGFSDEVMGMSPESVEIAATAAKALTDMTASIPNEGGVTAWFAGENSISKFSDDIVELGKGLKGFSDEIKGIVPENVVAASSAAKALAEMTTFIPNEGGVVAWFTGENSITRFADDIVVLGKGLKGFSDAVKGIVTINVTMGAAAAKALAEMTSMIPNQGGVAAWFAGETSITKYAGQLPILGEGLKGFSDAVTDISPEKVTSAANAAKALAEMTNILPNQGGVVSWFAGETSVASFGEQLVSLGKGLNSFGKSVADMPVENVSAAVSAAKSIAEMTTYIPNQGGVTAWFTGETSIANFADALPKLGKGLSGFSSEINGINAENVTAAANAANALAEMTSVIPTEGGIKAWFTGETSIANFADKLPALGEGLKGFSNSVAGINAENVTAAASAAKSLGEMTSVIPSDTKKLSSFGDNLAKFGEKIASYFSKTSGITKESISATTGVIDVVERVASVNSGNIKSVANSIDDISKSLTNLSKIPKNSTAEFSSAMKELGEASADKLVEALKAIEDDTKKAGEDAMKAFVEGVKGSTNKAKAACTDIAKACADAIGSKVIVFTAAGKDLVDGFASGISANSYKAAAKAKAMAEAAAKAAKDALDINSPSKVFRAIGGSIPEGFAEGIDKFAGMVKGSTLDMADTAVGAVGRSIASLSNMVDNNIDAQPTIRPVLDLSDIKSGIGAMNGLFGNSSIGVMANVNAISSSMNGRVQNGNNDDVVSAIDKLRAELDGVKGDSYYFGNISYNDDAQVQDAVRTLVRAVKIGGRS